MSDAKPPAELDPDRLPWDKQPFESVGAFRAFALYRDLMDQRTLARVAKDLKKTLGAIKDLSAKYRWVERVEAYELHYDRRMRESRETAAEKSLAQHAALFRQIQGLAAVRITGGVIERGGKKVKVEALDPNTMDAAQVVRAAEVGVKGERLSIGLPTDFLRTLHQISTPEFERVVSAIIDEAISLMPDEKAEEFVERVRRIGLGPSRQLPA